MASTVIGGLGQFPSPWRAVMGPTYLDVRVFVERFVVALLLQLLLPRTFVVLRTRGDPNRGVSLTCRGLRNPLGEIGVVHAL